MGPEKKFLKVGGVPGKVVGGWSVGGITVYSTGVPFTPSLAVDPTGLGLGILPDLLGDPNQNAPHTANRWFNTTVSRVPVNSYGNIGRNVVAGPSISEWDVTLSKATAFRENYNLVFKAELFNVINKAQFLLPQRSFGASDFGKILQAREPREIQFSLSFAF